MNEFSASKMASIAGHFARVTRNIDLDISRKGADHVQNQIAAEFFDDDRVIPEMERLAAELDLPVSAKLISRIRTEFNKPFKLSALKSEFTSLNRTWVIELESKKFFHLPPDKAIYYKDDPEEVFDSEVCDAFPSAGDDLVEASKCYALGRSTACVFHLMRVVEFTSNAVVASLVAPVPSDGGIPGWGRNRRILNAYLENKARESRPADWSQREPFYNEMRADWNAMYKAWRCDTVHDLSTVYTMEKAKWIMEAVHETLRHVASHVDEAGAYTP